MNHSYDPGAPKIEYSSRLEARRSAAARRGQQDQWMGTLRLATAALAAVIAWLAFKSALLSPWWLMLPAGVFTGLVLYHDKVRRNRQSLARAIAYYERGMARIDGRWMGSGEKGESYRDPHHPYADDLDLFGTGSIFELICTAGTGYGIDTLAGWLKSPATPHEILRRQEAVAELKPQIQLREDLAILGADIGSAIDSEALSTWGSGQSMGPPGAVRIVAAVLAFLGISSLLWWIFRDERIWFSIAATAEGLLVLWLRHRVRHIIFAAEMPLRNLLMLSQVMRRLEKEHFRAHLLQELRLGLEAEDNPPSRQILALSRLMTLLDSRRNVIFAPLAALLLWGTQFALAVESWRNRSGGSLPRWLRALGEFEALCALSGYAYEHPDDPFPEICETGAVFEADEIAHPLLQEGRAIRNGIVLGAQPQVLLVSGSNMSGKSTLLRTVGANAVLALAGGPVRARRLRLSPLAVAASIRISDSLQEGSSRFYSEITRIRTIVEMTKGGTPVLFLLDELLQGTNSHDRRIGAEAVIRTLVQRGAVGLMTTHDLALAEIEKSLAPLIANVHFEDHIEGGRIAFDYTLRPGVVQKSNALELMRSVGLDV